MRFIASQLVLAFALVACNGGDVPPNQIEPVAMQPAADGGGGAAARTRTGAGAAGSSSVASTPMTPGAGGSAGAAGDAAAIAEADGGRGGTPAADGGSGAGQSAAVGGAAAPPDRSQPASCRATQAGADTPAIYVIGDSTASVYTSDLYPRMGWAQPLQEFFAAACATVHDEALSGRSSKSFYDEGAWTPVKNALRAGDFVLIQFGHNDEKADDSARYTDPKTTYPMYLSKYIDDTLAAGATPILLTSIERNSWSGGQLKATHGAYPQAVRELAAQRTLTLVDMTKLTHDYFEKLGQAATTKLFLNLAPGESPNYPNGNSDDTHLQDKGAHVVAEIALADVARQQTPLAALLKSVPSPP
jgi:lysophospholipase L1-like esterase